MRALALGALLLAGAAQAQVGERVPVGAFAIDRTEVTIGQFRAFAAATATTTAAEAAGGGFEFAGGWVRRRGWTVYRPFGEEPASPDEPAVHVTWHEARAYCAWAGGRLPSVAEWQHAAYTETRANPPAPFVIGRTYPLPVAEPSHANTRDRDPWPRSAPAGRTTPGVNGLYDMGGNVWEWAEDGEGAERRTMGGSWWYGPAPMRRGADQPKPADFHAVYVGFRCVYDR
jgi:formylglycine-generating enzyme required for sulfatase activity